MPVRRNVGDLYIVMSRKLHDCENISAENLMFLCTRLSLVRKVWSSSRLWGQSIRMSSMYLFQSRGFRVCWLRNFSSNWPKYMVAKAGASLVPMAMPHNCVNMRLSNWNTLFFRTYLRRSRRKTLRG